MFWVIETKTMNQGFRFNNPKHFSNSIIFVSFYSSRRVIKNAVFIFSQMFKDFELFSSQYADFIDSEENYQLHVFVVIHKISKIANFACNYLENDNDSEFTVKTKNAPSFMNFPNINKNGNFFSDQAGPLRIG